MFAAFISIPKNASKTIRAMLGETGDILDENHCPARHMRQGNGVSDLFTFCFVRNPYERVRSWYAFHRIEQQTTGNKLPYLNYPSLEAWVMDGMPHHWKSTFTPLLQTSFTKGARLDFTGRIEHFERDMRRLIDELNRRSPQRSFRYLDLRINKTAYQNVTVPLALSDRGRRLIDELNRRSPQRSFRYLDLRINKTAYQKVTVPLALSDRGRQRVGDLLEEDFEAFGYPR